MRVFVGEPGAEHRETFASAGQAAAAGGVTTIVTMPDTDPVIDDIALVDFIARRARDEAEVRVYPMAALTKGLAGREMTEFGLLQEAGAVGFTDGRRSVTDAGADAPRADLRPRLRRADHAPPGRPDADRHRRDERRRGRDAARPLRHPEGGRDHHARARHSPRRADRRALSRRADLVRRSRSTSSAAPRRAGWRSPAASRSPI